MMFGLTKILNPKKMLNPNTISQLKYLSSIQRDNTIDIIEKKYNVIQFENKNDIINDSRFNYMNSDISNKDNPVIFNHKYGGKLQKCFWTRKSNHIIKEIKNTQPFNQLFQTNLQSTKECNLTINLLGNKLASVETIMSSLITNPNCKIIRFGSDGGLSEHISLISGLTNTSSLEPSILEWLKDKPKLNLDNLIYIGAHNISPYEYYIIKKHNITYIEPPQVPLLFDYYKLEDKIYGCDVHIVFDVNILYPMTYELSDKFRLNGLDSYQINSLITFINNISNVFKIDIHEFNPSLSKSTVDDENMTYVDFESILHKSDINNLINKYNNYCTKVIIRSVLAPLFGYHF